MEENMCCINFKKHLVIHWRFHTCRLPRLSPWISSSVRFRWPHVNCRNLTVSPHCTGRSSHSVLRWRVSSTLLLQTHTLSWGHMWGGNFLILNGLDFSVKKQSLISSTVPFIGPRCSGKELNRDGQTDWGMNITAPLISLRQIMASISTRIITKQRRFQERLYIEIIVFSRF